MIALRCRYWVYLAVWLIYIVVLAAIARLRPEHFGGALIDYAVFTWIAAILLGVYEFNRVVAYLRRNHTWYLADLRKRYPPNSFPPVKEFMLAGAPEFLSSTDSRGDPSLTYYRRRARIIVWVMPLMFVHSAAIFLVVFLFGL
jgi:hypothetical protein